eukprot:1799470-Amphidinium_carterae.1
MAVVILLFAFVAYSRETRKPPPHGPVYQVLHRPISRIPPHQKAPKVRSPRRMEAQCPVNMIETLMGKILRGIATFALESIVARMIRALVVDQTDSNGTIVTSRSHIMQPTNSRPPIARSSYLVLLVIDVSPAAPHGTCQLHQSIYT